MADNVTALREEVQMLREALIAMGRQLPGALVASDVSSRFLTHLPAEMAHYELRLRKEGE